MQSNFQRLLLSFLFTSVLTIGASNAQSEAELEQRFWEMSTQARAGLNFEEAREHVREIAIALRRAEELRSPTSGSGTALVYRQPGNIDHYPNTVAGLQEFAFARFGEWLKDHPEYASVREAELRSANRHRTAVQYAAYTFAIVSVMDVLRILHQPSLSGAGRVALSALVLAIPTYYLYHRREQRLAAQDAANADALQRQFFENSDIGRWIRDALAVEGLAVPAFSSVPRTLTLREHIAEMMVGATLLVTLPLTAWRNWRQPGTQALPAEETPRPVSRWNSSRRSFERRPRRLALTQEHVRIQVADTSVAPAADSNVALLSAALQAFSVEYSSSADSGLALQVAQKICPVFTIEHATEALGSDDGTAIVRRR